MPAHTLDLNLLRVFESIYRMRNLSEVARHVHLTQPAVSHALRRLRDSLGDPLFVRSVNGLQPTPRSEQLIEPVRQALRLIEDSVSSSGVFEPAKCTREFQLLLSDVGELVFLPRLLRHLRQHTPAASAVVVQASRVQYEAMLRERVADIAIGHLPNMPATLKQRSLFRDDYVVLRTRPARKRRRALTLEEYVRSVHIEVDPPGSLQRPVQMVMESLGLQHRVVLRVPHFFAVPSILLQTDLLVTVPRSVARNIRNADDLEICDVPFAMPPLDIRMYWHLRQDADPAHRWLRNAMVALFSSSSTAGS
ncbi:Nodulation protein D 2 [Variovorax sp. PBS-H4]|uniref:LysR family transcriptional regulator n=1 Tax=Variovorax sp. PBS-H4 TaxID=434008 RepID=UPI0013172315|nr:LysR family transcriptional regulator [Variovorax sp. PBS-H4]VTU22943.1 Nodulation protein D 2 [Variovorax sp. PBS-H4]